MSAKISQFCHSDGLVYWGECCFQTHIAALRRNLHDWEIWKEIRGTTRVLAILDFIFGIFWLGLFKFLGALCVFLSSLLSPPGKFRMGGWSFLKLVTQKFQNIFGDLQSNSTLLSNKSHNFFPPKMSNASNCIPAKRRTNLLWPIFYFYFPLWIHFYWIGPCWIFQ